MTDVITDVPRCSCGAPLTWIDCRFCADGHALFPEGAEYDEEGDGNEPFCTICHGEQSILICPSCDLPETATATASEEAR